MLPWQPKFYQNQTFFLYNFLFLEFQWIRFSNYRVIVKLFTQLSTCKPDDVIIFTVVVVCSEPILSIMFRPFKRWYLWNQIRYQRTVNSVHSCFSCTFIWENKNFRFISTLKHLFVSMSVKQNLFVSVFVHECLMMLNDVEYTTSKCLSCKWAIISLLFLFN